MVKASGACSNLFDFVKRLYNHIIDFDAPLIFAEGEFTEYYIEKYDFSHILKYMDDVVCWDYIEDYRYHIFTLNPELIDFKLINKIEEDKVINFKVPVSEIKEGQKYLEYQLEDINNSIKLGLKNGEFCFRSVMSQKKTIEIADAKEYLLSTLKIQGMVKQQFEKYNRPLIIRGRELKKFYIKNDGFTYFIETMIRKLYKWDYIPDYDYHIFVFNPEFVDLEARKIPVDE